MTLRDTADAILRGLEAREVTGKGIGDITNAASDRGITDHQLIGRAATYLNQRGLLENFHGIAGGGHAHYIGDRSGAAVLLIDGLPPDASPIEALQRAQEPQSVASYHGPVFHGDVHGSNVAVASPAATQNIANGSDLTGVVEALIAALRDAPDLDDQEREEALEDAESLKEQLEKDKPNSRVVMVLLGGLAKLSLAGVYLKQIREGLGY